MSAEPFGPEAFAALGARQVPPELRWYATTRADRHCQRRTWLRRRRVARLIFVQATLKLHQGLPWEKVLDHLAIGTSQLQARYERLYGERPSTSTLRLDVQAILGGPTGALRSDFSMDALAYGQASTYSIRNVHVTLGNLGRKLMLGLANELAAIGFSRSPHRECFFMANSVLRRARSALRKAQEDGWGWSRHYAGLKLAWRLAHLGVPEATAHKMLSEYREGVPAVVNGRKYERREARRAVESAYRKLRP